MAHTDVQSQQLGPSDAIWRTVLPLFLALLPFPYAMFVGLVGFFSLGLWQTYRYPGLILTRLYRSGFIAISLLLVVSSSFANFPGEAFVQLTHFIPFFWFWAIITAYLETTTEAWPQLYRWTRVLVWTSVPINLIGIYEYVLKMLHPAGQLTSLPGLDWLYIGDLHIPRAYSVFDYPNTLASYLVMILGLNLGLVLLSPHSRHFSMPRWQRLGLTLNLVLVLGCLFCAGSRNGFLVAIAVLLVGIFAVRGHRWVKLVSLAGLALVGTLVLRFGLAGRSVSLTWLTQDPRFGVWSLAVDMIRDRPLLGQGLGNYKLLYNGEVPLYDYIAHAHNLWLMLASEAGLPAMIMVTFAVGVIWYRGVNALVSLRSQTNPFSLLMGYHLCFLSIVLFSLLDVTLTESRVNLVAWLSLGVIYAGSSLSQRLSTMTLDEFDGL
jgi:hypothetical protein